MQHFLEYSSKFLLAELSGRFSLRSVELNGMKHSGEVPPSASGSIVQFGKLILCNAANGEKMSQTSLHGPFLTL